MERDFRTIRNGTKNFAAVRKKSSLQKALSGAFSDVFQKGTGKWLVRALPLALLAGANAHADPGWKEGIIPDGIYGMPEYGPGAHGNGWALAKGHDKDKDKNKNSYLHYDEDRGRMMFKVPSVMEPVGAATVQDGIVFGDGNKRAKLNVENGALDIVGDGSLIKTELVPADGRTNLKISGVREGLQKSFADFGNDNYALKKDFKDVAIDLNGKIEALNTRVSSIQAENSLRPGNGAGNVGMPVGGNYFYEAANGTHNLTDSSLKTEGAVNATEFKVASSSDPGQAASVTYDEKAGRLIMTKADPNARAADPGVGLATVNDGVTFGDGTNASLLNVQNGRLDIVGDDKNIKTELVDNGDGTSQLKISYIGEAPAGVIGSAGGLNIAAGGDYQAVTIEQGNVSMGGNRIQNVGDAKEAGDAVNLGQLNKTAQNLHNEIRRVDREARAGIAQAIAVAGLPQAYMPGRSMLTAAAGTYRGQGGFALGFSHATENRQWVVKGSASADTNGGFGGSVGAGFQF